MKRFKKDSKPKLVFRKAIKKPIEVESREGIMKGKTGDWLMKGVSGELYVCDKTIFEKTYNLTN
jgi:hypothetical protein